MPTIDHETAVEICAKFFEEELARDPATAVTPIHDNPFESPLLIGPSSPPSEEQIARAPRFLVEMARVDLKTHKGLLEGCRQVRKGGAQLPQVIVEWLVGLQLDEIAPPEARKRSQKDIVEGLVYHTIAALVILTGRSPTQNRETGIKSKKPEKRSACDVVADAFKKIRSPEIPQLPGSHDGVKGYWMDAKKLYGFDKKQYERFAAARPSRIWKTLKAVSARGD